MVRSSFVLYLSFESVEKSKSSSKLDSFELEVKNFGTIYVSWFTAAASKSISFDAVLKWWLVFFIFLISFFYSKLFLLLLTRIFRASFIRFDMLVHYKFFTTLFCLSVSSISAIFYILYAQTFRYFIFNFSFSGWKFRAWLFFCGETFF